MKAFKMQQGVLVSAFSKTLARNLHKSINNFEQETTNRVSKQLMRRAEFAADFKYIGSASDDSHESKGIEKAVNDY